MKTLKLGLVSGLIGEAVLWSVYLAFSGKGPAGVNNVVDAVRFLHTPGFHLAHAFHVAGGWFNSLLLFSTGAAQLALLACVGMAMTVQFQARRPE